MAPRTDRLEIRLTDLEREHFAASADRSGESLAAWLRRAGRERIQREEGRWIGLPLERRVK